MFSQVCKYRLTSWGSELVLQIGIWTLTSNVNAIDSLTGKTATFNDKCHNHRHSQEMQVTRSFTHYLEDDLDLDREYERERDLDLE